MDLDGTEKIFDDMNNMPLPLIQIQLLKYYLKHS